MADDRAAIAHLLRRTTFGPAPGQVEALNAGGVSAALEQVLAATPPPLPAAPNMEGWVPPIWWMLRMADPAVGLAEKMTWFWHAHLCTSMDKVGSWEMMWTSTVTSVFGQYPNWATLDTNDNLKCTVTMAEYYATLAQWMGVNPGDVLAGNPSPLAGITL